MNGDDHAVIAPALRRLVVVLGDQPGDRARQFLREGGSIGAVVSMEKVFKCPILFLGLSLPEHGYHAPNENYDWQQAAGGMAAFAKYFDVVANLS